MSEQEEKRPLKMYPGVSLGSTPRRGMSKITVFLLILIVIAGASAGGYWINREFIAKESEIPEIVEIVESEPEPVKVKIEDASQPAELDLTFTTAEATATATANAEANDLDLENIDLTTTTADVADDDLGLEELLTEDTATTTPTSEPETTATPPANTNIIDQTITTVSDTVNNLGQSVAATVNNFAGTPSTPEDIVKEIKAADALSAKQDYNAALTKLTRLAELPAATLGKFTPDIYYRLGLANRYAKNEDAAQSAWKKAYTEYPDTISGRLSALALADTWYYWYVQSNQDLSKWESIRDAYSTAIGMDGARFLPAATEASIAQKLNYLNETLIFNPKVKVNGAVFHNVEPGEYISTIARNYGLGTWTSITEINQVDPKNLKVGMTLKIVPGRLFILVDQQRMTLSWYLDGKFIKRYRCATGAAGSETPVGHYEVFKMDVEPNWTDPKTGKVYKYGEPGHAIGSRWLALRGGSKSGLGIHGTIDPDSIGSKASNGCIRLLNQDVEELYGFASVDNNNETEVLVID